MMPEPHRNGRDGTNNMQLLAVAIGEYSTHFAVKSLRYLNTRQHSAARSLMSCDVQMDSRCPSLGKRATTTRNNQQQLAMAIGEENARY